MTKRFFPDENKLAGCNCGNSFCKKSLLGRSYNLRHKFTNKRSIKINDLFSKRTALVISKIFANNNTYITPKRKTRPWVTFNHALNWLDTNDESIKNFCIIKKNKKELFLLNNRFLSNKQLIIYLNKKRIEKGLDPFYVDSDAE